MKCYLIALTLLALSVHARDEVSAFESFADESQLITENDWIPSPQESDANCERLNLRFQLFDISGIKGGMLHSFRVMAYPDQTPDLRDSKPFAWFMDGIPYQLKASAVEALYLIRSSETKTQVGCHKKNEPCINVNQENSNESLVISIDRLDAVKIKFNFDKTAQTMNLKILSSNAPVKKEVSCHYKAWRRSVGQNFYVGEAFDARKRPK